MRWIAVDQLNDALLDWAWKESLDVSSTVCEGLDREQKREAVRDEYGDKVPVPHAVLTRLQED